MGEPYLFNLGHLDQFLSDIQGKTKTTHTCYTIFFFTEYRQNFCFTPYMTFFSQARPDWSQKFNPLYISKKNGIVIIVICNIKSEKRVYKNLCLSDHTTMLASLVGIPLLFGSESCALSSLHRQLDTSVLHKSPHKKVRVSLVKCPLCL